MLSARQISFIEGQQVARLATADGNGVPHIVPVCFVLIRENVYIALDAKPKRTTTLRLKRVLNITENPRVSLLFDRYDNDWTKLAWVRLDGDAEMLLGSPERQEALGLLRERYAQYESLLPENSPVIAVRISHASSWGDLG
jgi:PPOX class probable F420-dependent enzyme